MSENLSVSGVLTPVDTDVFSLIVRAGERYVVRLDGVAVDGATEGVVHLSVLTREGEWLNAVSNFAQTGNLLQTVFSAPHDGVVHLRLVSDRSVELPQDAGPEPLSPQALLAHGQAAAADPWLGYTLSVAPGVSDDHADTRVAGTEVASNQTLAATLDQTGDRDWFRVYLQRGERLMLLPSTPDAQDVWLDAAVWDPRGAWIAWQSIGWPQESVVVAAKQDGWYDIEISSRSGESAFASGPVAYELQLHGMPPEDHGDEPDQATPMHLGTAAPFVLDHKGDDDWIRLQPRTGELYRVAVVDDDGQPMTQVGFWMRGRRIDMQELPGEVTFIAVDDEPIEISLYVPWGTVLTEAGEAPHAPETLLAGRLVWERIENEQSGLFGDAWAGWPPPAEPAPIHIALGGMPEQPLQFDLQPSGSAEVLLPLAAGDRVRYTIQTELRASVLVRTAWDGAPVWMPGSDLWHEPGRDGDDDSAPSATWFEAPSPGLYAFHLFAHGAAQDTADGKARVVRLELTVQPPDDHGDTQARATPLVLNQSVGALLGENDLDVFVLGMQAGQPYLVTIALPVGSLLNWMSVGEQAYAGWHAEDDAPAAINLPFVPQASGLQALTFLGSGQIHFTVTELPLDDHGDTDGTATLLNPPLEGPLELDELLFLGLPDAAPTTGFDAVALAFAA